MCSRVLLINPIITFGGRCTIIGAMTVLLHFPLWRGRYEWYSLVFTMIESKTSQDDRVIFGSGVLPGSYGNLVNLV